MDSAPQLVIASFIGGLGTYRFLARGSCFLDRSVFLRWAAHVDNLDDKSREGDEDQAVEDSELWVSLLVVLIV